MLLVRFAGSQPTGTLPQNMREACSGGVGRGRGGGGGSERDFVLLL